MASFYLFFCTLFFLQEAWSGPAASPEANPSSDKPVVITPGAQLANNMNDNLLKIMDNVRTGSVKLTIPVIKFGGETVPKLFSAGLKTMGGTPSKVVNANKKGFGKMITGMSKVASGGALLGTAIVGTNMHWMGNGLSFLSNIVDWSAKFGLSVTGNMGDPYTFADNMMTNMTNNILGGVGSGMDLAGSGATIMSQGTSKIIEALGKTIAKGASNVQDTMNKWLKNRSANLQGRAMTLSSVAQLQYYNALQWYIHHILAMETLMDRLTDTINSAGSNNSTSSVTEDPSGGTTNNSDKQ